MSAVAEAVRTETAARRAKRHLEQLRLERNGYDDHWRELQKFFLTRRGRWLQDGKQKAGGKQNQNLIDPTPKFAARTLGAGMHAGSTNPATPWFRLATPDPEMMEFPSVSLWLYDVENRMRDVFSRSNLYGVLPMSYMEAGVFGTAPILVLDHPTKVVHFVPKTVGSYYLATDPDGTIDTMLCEYQLTARQMITQFGETGVTAQTREAERTNPEKLIDVLHVIEPNQSRDATLRDNRNMPFSSQYFELKAPDTERPAKTSGFEDNPLAVFRWETTELTDPYGSSCGMDALGLSKALQFQTKQKAKVIDKHVDPPMVGDAALKNQPSSLVAGDVTYAGFTANGAAPRFQPAIQVSPQAANIVLEDINDIREVIHQAMYTDLFLAITMADPRNATVPEIDARKEEQILALGPVLQNHEAMMKQIIERTFNIMMRAGLIPPPPRELYGVNLRVEMIGALAQAFRSIAAGKVDRFVGFVGAVAKAQADAGQPVTAFDKWDADQSIDEYAAALGVPPTIVRSDDTVAQIRQIRAQQEQAAQAAAAAQPMKDIAGAAKALSETKLNTGSALDAVAG